ncbi:C-terminal binding protein [Dasania marina]|uniref:C-terminal binding protein n=1 Tax=Dasania marina TaxID=471499 RepID=UPI00037EFDDC|nr:C-terminal binding protein [Dasania marina]
MFKICMTDYQFATPDLEYQWFTQSGIEFVAAQCQNTEQLLSLAKDADGIISSYFKISADIIQQLPKLKCISSLGVGVDHIDLPAAKAAGVMVANVPDAYTEEVATTALAMALSLIRHLPFLHDSVKQGHWDYLKTGCMQRPSEMTLGIAGFGKIGRSFAKLAQPCFGNVIAFDPFLADEHWPPDVQQMTSLLALVEQADVLSLHMPINADNYHLLGRELLAAMKPGSYLINVARGELIDSQALTQALDCGHLAGAALDVLEHEPPLKNDQLVVHPRVLVNPHASFYSTASEREARYKAAHNLITWVKTGQPNYRVV